MNLKSVYTDGVHLRENAVQFCKSAWFQYKGLAATNGDLLSDSFSLPVLFYRLGSYTKALLWFIVLVIGNYGLLFYIPQLLEYVTITINLVAREQNKNASNVSMFL